MRGEVAIGPSIYGVYVIDGSLCSRVYGIPFDVTHFGPGLVMLLSNHQQQVLILINTHAVTRAAMACE